MLSLGDSPKGGCQADFESFAAFAESVERNHHFAAVAREASHFVRDLSLLARPAVTLFTSRKARWHGAALAC